MKEVISNLVFGYHGCDQEVADEVLLRDGDLKASRNVWDWLGEGVYFWESAPKRALEWAEDMARHGRIKKPAVIGAVISLGTCMNLMDTDSQDVLSMMYERMKLLNKNLPINKGTNHSLDRTVVDFACQYLKSVSHTNVDTVRGAFPEGKPIFNESKILTKTHVQIAVRNPKVILAYFKPRGLFAQ